MIILPACEFDLPQILALQKAAFESEARLVENWDIPPLTQTLENLVEEWRTGVTLKALDGQTLVGTVRARTTEDTVHIGRLAVLPQWQGRGCGSALMTAILSATKAARYELFTSAKSERNLRLYQKLGFVPYKKAQTANGVELVWLEKISNLGRE
ncbi:GNAT family N-acetyltransferase [Desulfovibrio sp.]|uniref:GNAT family N-acetyltransferase n=1 Tax=Desulfovibrio sp. TaxID=885 RepID=UPI0025C5F884|nr:GNAT family N-acetyltransferase [Desulfovibrio sp.]